VDRPVSGRAGADSAILLAGSRKYDADRSGNRQFRPASRLPSPSRHIYNPLTIAVAFRPLLAFDRVWQHPIKVDGTFA
jgi:hypothetical protein